MAAGETTGGAIQGGLQGAATGSAFGPPGAVIGGVLGFVSGGFAGAFSSRSRARQRRARRRQLFQQIEQLQAVNVQQREQARRLRSRQRAAFGAAGVRSTTGTAQAVQQLTLHDAVLNQERILRGVAAIREQIRREHRGSRAIDTAALFSQAISGIGGAFDRFAQIEIAKGQ